MPFSAIGARNSSQRVQLDVDGNVTGCGVEKIEELQLRVFQSRIGHVIDQGQRNPPTPLGMTVARGHGARTTTFCPATWNSSAVDDQWHFIPPAKGVFRLPYFFVASSACDKSSRISSMCSMPTLRRIISGVTPTFACSSGVSCR